MPIIRFQATELFILDSSISMRSQLQILWYYLKRVKLVDLSVLYFRMARNRLLRLIYDRPLRTASLLRFLPLVIAGVLGWLVASYGSLHSPLPALGTSFAIVLAIWLCLLSVALLTLSAQLLIPYLKTWRAWLFRGISFFAPISLFLYVYDGKPSQEWTISGVWLLLWIMCFGIVEYLAESIAWQSKRRLRRFQIGQDKMALDDSEYWRVCVHEAGHLLLYGQCTALPEDAMAIADREPQYGFGGFVTPVDMSESAEITTDILQWQAIMSYAGAAAERAIFGANCEGAAKDHEMADNYISRLAALKHENYFVNPKNVTEESANIMAICQLRAECQKLAEEFLANNKQQLLQIAEMLRDTECVACDNFYPIWQTLALPPGWKKIELPSRIPMYSGSA